MKKQLAFLNTFDYELYLGKSSGTAENCLLKPTDLLLQILRRHQLPGIFFIDATYLYRLKEVAASHPAAMKDFDSICSQVKQIKNEGHRVYLHLHPHWLDARYHAKASRWNLSDKSHFSFNSLTEPQREEVFRIAYQTLAAIIDNGIAGFRAGGLYIQPFTDFQALFVRHGIKNEFSVLRGAYSREANGCSFDFTEYIRPYAYRFENDVLKKNAKGHFTEFTINTIEIPFTYRLANRIAGKLLSRKTGSGRFGDGLPSGNRIFFKSPPKNATVETMAAENISLVKEPLYLSEAAKSGYLHLLSHPKLVSLNTLRIYDRFLGKLKMKFDVVTDLDSILKMQNDKP